MKKIKKSNMYIYRFRVLSDLNDNFVKDIEILSDKTFEDFHNAMKKYLSLDGNELASFHICDRKWNKKKEFTLIDMKKENPENMEKSGDVAIMGDISLKDVISEPNQRLIYEYDFLNMFTFFIELQKVTQGKNGVEYPNCVFEKGNWNEEHEPELPANQDEEELSKKLLDDFNEILQQTYDYDSNDMYDAGE
ncbi:MAG: plasmid pRiA4b ORF-3 family protein [Bacteroidales bacterium]|nr:plasmid pRiA4b ORF-3 family protein [Bacteroidales bacterium]